MLQDGYFIKNCGKKNENTTIFIVVSIIITDSFDFVIF